MYTNKQNLETLKLVKQLILKNKYVVISILIILTLIGVGSGVYFGNKSQQNNKEIANAAPLDDSIIKVKPSNLTVFGDTLIYDSTFTIQVTSLPTNTTSCSFKVNNGTALTGTISGTTCTYNTALNIPVNTNFSPDAVRITLNTTTGGLAYSKITDFTVVLPTPTSPGSRPYDFNNSKLSLILTGNQAPIYTNIKQVGSTDTVGVKLSDLNLYTNLDLENTSKKYACFFYAKQLSDTNWRPLNYDDSIASVNKNKGVLYNPTGNVGCSANFTRSNVTREYPGTNSDGSGNTDGTTVKSDPITAFGWEFRIDVRESADGQTPTITNTLIHSNKGNLNLLFIGALGS